eukprot:11060364-Heterocapsa_arctica.AAC.1
MGADFQTPPQEIESTGFAAKLGCKVLQASDNMGACKGKSGMSTIDFVVVEGNLAKGVIEVSTMLDIDPHPHRPVRISI